MMTPFGRTFSIVGLPRVSFRGVSVAGIGAKLTLLVFRIHAQLVRRLVLELVEEEAVK